MKKDKATAKMDAFVEKHANWPQMSREELVRLSDNIKKLADKLRAKKTAGFMKMAKCVSAAIEPKAKAKANANAKAKGEPKAKAKPDAKPDTRAWSLDKARLDYASKMEAFGLQKVRQEEPPYLESVEDCHESPAKPEAWSFSSMDECVDPLPESIVE